MADDGPSLRVTVSCANCGQEQKIMKRCTRCAQIFYCSRQCQMKDWPVHKAICNSQKKIQTSETLHGRSGPYNCNKKENESYQDKQSSLKSEQGQSLQPADGSFGCNNCTNSGLLNTQECKTRQEPCVNAERTSTNELQQHIVRRCSSKKELEVQGVSNETFLFTAAEQQSKSSKSAQELSDTCIDVDVITIYIKHNKSRHELELSPLDTDRSFHMISEFLHIPASKLKLIHRGKMVVESNIKEFLQDKALFLAFGEIAESEEGLENGAVDTIVKQLGVERNTAIKALRKTGCIIDAIIELGNR